MSTSIPVRSNGQPIDQTWFNIPRSEISVLDDRVDALGSGHQLPFNINGPYYIAGGTGSKDGIVYHKVTQSITVTSAIVKIITAGSSGSTKVDIKRKRSTGSWISLFTTVPIVPATAGDLADSSTGTGATTAVVAASMQALIPDDLLRLDIQQSQGGTPDSFIFQVYYDVNGV